MDKRMKSRRRLALTPLLVFTCLAVVLAAVQIAYAWYVVMIASNQTFKIGIDSQKYLKSIYVADPPMQVIDKISISLFQSDSPTAPQTKVKSGIILNRFYTMEITIELIEGEEFHEVDDNFLEYYMEPFKLDGILWPAVNKIICFFTADFTNYRIVRFDVNGGTPKIAFKAVTVNGTIKAPKDPQRSGYEFDGWWTSATGGEKFNFSQPITKDITLFAQWKPLAPPTTTTTTTTTTITTTTEEITTTEETTTPTTVEETTTWLPGSETTITPETSPTLPTDPIDGEDDSDKPSVPLIIGFIIGASVIGGLGGFIIFSIREKKKYG